MAGRAGFSTASGRRARPTKDKAIIARSLAALFLAGASVSAVYLVLPHPTSPTTA